MNPLYMPGAVLQAILVMAVFGIISVFMYMGGKIYFQQRTIAALNKEIQEYSYKVEDLNTSNAFLRSNITHLKDYYKQKSKPVIVNGELKIENLFSAEPR